MAINYNDKSPLGSTDQCTLYTGQHKDCGLPKVKYPGLFCSELPAQCLTEVWPHIFLLYLSASGFHQDITMSLDVKRNKI